jgi:hypothetical protein
MKILILKYDSLKLINFQNQLLNTLDFDVYSMQRPCNCKFSASSFNFGVVA